MSFIYFIVILCVGVNTLKTLGIIPARYASTRLPGKLIASLCGKPLIQWVYERSQKASLLNELIVATDDERIYNTVRNFGGSVVMTDANHPNGTSRAAEASKGIATDIVVVIQGDEPLISSIMIDETAKLLLDNPQDVSATLMRPVVPEDYHKIGIVKTVFDKDSYALYFSRSLIPYLHTEFKTTIYEHIGIFAYTKEFLLTYASLPETPLAKAESLEQLKVLEHGYKMRVAVTKCEEIGFCVDTIEDLERMREYYSLNPVKIRY
jgi:3-deoxy-manno-octulosonate cytidylyltransferase (CMP-KDO synthetase)